VIINDEIDYSDYTDYGDYANGNIFKEGFAQKPFLSTPNVQ